MIRPRFLRARLVLGVIAFTGCGKPQDPAQQVVAPPAPVVFVVEAKPAPSPAFGQVIAKLEGSAVTPVTAPASGFLIKQVLPEGAMIRKGEVLFLLNPQPPSPANKGYIRIVSPADGMVGHASLGPGDIVAAGATLVTIAQIDPISAEFSIPVAYYHSRMADFLLPVLQRADEFELILPGGSIYPVKGRLEMANEFTSGINATVAARASFPNPGKVLRPGDYAKVVDATPASSGAVTIPLGCIRLDPSPVHVEVLRADDTIELRPVVASPASGSICTITSGLKAGERVIVNGAEKCAPGTKVSPQPYVAPGT